MWFVYGYIVIVLATRMHGPMPFWWHVLVFFCVDFAMGANGYYWVQFEILSIPGVVAMTRDLVRKGYI